MANRQGPKPSEVQASPSIRLAHEQGDPSPTMSPFSRKVTIDTMDQWKSRNMSGHASSLIVNRPSSPLPDQNPLARLGLMNLRRPAIPRPGLTQGARITQQIKAIELITKFTPSERLAIVSDVASCLPDLRRLLKGNKSSRALAAKARKLIALHNAAAVVEKANLEDLLCFLSETRLPEALTREEFEDCFDTLEEFIYLLRPFAKQTGQQSAWQAVVASFLHQYFRLLPDTGTGETPVRASPRSWDAWPTNERVQPMTPPNTTETAHNHGSTLSDTPSTHWPYLDQGLDRHATLERLHAIVTYLTELNHLDPGLYREYATNFFPALVSIIDEFFKIISNRIFSSDHVRECLAAGLVWKSFTQTWGNTVQDALAERLLSLANQARASPIEVPEAAFSKTMDELLVLSSHHLLETSTALSDSEEGGLIESKFAVRARKFCKLIHHKWQIEAYRSELHRLWYLIWRSLRVLYKIKERTDILQRAEEGFIDAAFFDMPLVSTTFARLLKISDTANPRSVEDLVAKYCRRIARCRSDPDDRYDHLRSYEETELRPHVVTSLERFIETQEAKDNLLQKLHRAVVRFNFITKGPATVRRWGTEVIAQDWTIELLDLMSPTKAVVPGPNSPTFLRPDGQTPMNDHFSNPLRTELPHPRGINVRSAFDYVYYPLPETRAHEFAQSALISRDLREPGTVSDGSRIEDLVNIPPRHVRGRSNLSPIEWPDFVTPYDVVKAMKTRASQVRGGILRIFGRTPPQPPHHLESTFRGDRRQFAAISRNRVGQCAFEKQSIWLRGGAGSPQGSSSVNARNGSDESQYGNQNEVAAFQQKHIEDFREKTRCYYADGFIAQNLLEKTSWDVAEAVQRYEAVEEVMRRSDFKGAEYWKVCAGFLEANYWNVRDALRYAEEQIDAFKRSLQPHEMIPNVEIVQYFIYGPEVHIRGADALSEYQTILRNRVNEFRDKIVKGDKVSDAEIHTLIHRFGNIDRGAIYHMDTRRVDAPCRGCYAFRGQLHHYCACTEDSPDFLTLETLRAGLNNCHPCPYYPGQYHHRQGRQSSPPAYLQRPERCRHKMDDQLLGSVFGGRQRLIVGVLRNFDAEAHDIFPHLLGPQQQDGSLLGPGGFGMPQLHDREWRIHIAKMLTYIATTTQDLREFVVGTLTRLGGEIHLDKIERDPPKRSSQAQTPTVELCRRAGFDLKASYEILWEMLTSNTHKFALLTFRHEFGRFIRTLRELRSLYLDLLLHNGFEEDDEDGMHLATVHRGTSSESGRATRNPDDSDSDHSDSDHSDSDHSDSDHSDSDHSDSDHSGPDSGDLDGGDLTGQKDSEDQESLSPDKASPLLRAPGEELSPLHEEIKPRRLPRYDEYNQMYLDELERELLVERGVGEEVVKQHARKEDRIQLLMRLDRRGDYGQGARNGYHAMTGNRGRRTAAFKENFENLVKELKHQNIAKFKKAQDKRRERRRRVNRKRRRENHGREDFRRQAREVRLSSRHSGAPDYTGIGEDAERSLNTEDGILLSASTAVSSSILSTPQEGDENRDEDQIRMNEQNNADTESDPPIQSLPPPQMGRGSPIPPRRRLYERPVLPDRAWD